MKFRRADLIKWSSIAVGLVVVISLLGYYVIPQYVFTSPGYSVYATGIVDHKSIGQGYTVSVRLFDDDPVNGIQSGTTLAYIVPEEDWEMVEWGDTVKIRLLPHVKAEIVELFPSLKLPEWRFRFLSGLRVEFVTDKISYQIGEKANFTVKIKNTQDELAPGESSGGWSVTLFENPSFWAFRDGKKMFSSQGNLETQELVLQPGEESEFNLVWEIGDVPEGVYYVRVYLGFFTGNPENTLTGTTMLEIET